MIPGGESAKPEAEDFASDILIPGEKTAGNEER
jgi:hypothetical protein